VIGGKDIKAIRSIPAAINLDDYCWDLAQMACVSPLPI
jgi:hypothetical protein